MIASSRLSRRPMLAIALALTAGLSATIDMSATASSTAEENQDDARLEPRDLPPGVAIERIVHTPKFQLGRNGGISMSVARLRLSPQARFDWFSGAPTLLLVESGELTLELADPNVSALVPSPDRTPVGGGKAGGRQDAMTSIAGERVIVPQAGSAFAAGGNIGPIRNDGRDEL